MKNVEMAQLFSEATPYIQKYHGKTLVIKYGGNAMVNGALKLAVMNDLVTLTLLGVKVVLVHGGGPAINAMLGKLGIPSRFVGGLRYTDAETMTVVQQVLAGQVNKDLVALLKGRGVGLCGMDGNTIACRRYTDADLGFVGEITHIDTTLIDHLLEDQFIPVIATVGMDPENGVLYNVNADTAAAAIAVALQAEKLVSMTDIAGLLRDKNDESTLIPEVELSEIEGYKAEGVIAGGMLPKIDGMADAIRRGGERSRHHRRPRTSLRSARDVQRPRFRHAVFTGNAAAAANKGGDAMNREKVIDRTSRYIMHTYARSPVVIERGEGLVARDANGRTYLDFTSGIGVNSLGFAHPAWLKAVTEQAGLVQHTSNLYYTAPCGRLARRLCQRTGLDRVFFGNSGAEANEGAIKCARKYSADKYGEGPQQGRHARQLVPRPHARHADRHRSGRCSTHDFGPFPADFAYVPAGDFDALAAAAGDGRTCAVMMELVQGEGGVVALEPDYVHRVADFCAARDILLIVDEVQTGVGRTGKFLACENYHLKPDIVTLAKGLGGGLPIGAVVASEKAAAGMGPGQPRFDLRRQTGRLRRGLRGGRRHGRGIFAKCQRLRRGPLGRPARAAARRRRQRPGADDRRTV